MKLWKRVQRSFKPSLYLITLAFFSSLCTKGNKNEMKENFIAELNYNTPKSQRVDFSSSLSVNIGQKFSVRYNNESLKCEGCTYEWAEGENVLSTSENLYMVICQEGEKKITFRILSPEGEEKHKKEFIISAQKQETKRPENVQKAINIYKDDIILIGIDTKQTRENVEKILNSISVLQGYVDQENACDAEAVYALALGKVVGILSQIQDLLKRYFVGVLTKQDVLLIFDQGVKPAKRDIEAVINSGSLPKNFGFDVKNLQIYVLRDFPETPVDETVRLNLSGRHGTAEFYLLASIAEFVSGVFDVMLSFNSAIDFLIDLPSTVSEMVNQRIPLLRIVILALIEELQRNPAFLELSTDAPARLQDARASFYLGFKYLQRMFDSIKDDTENQDLRIIRYWDCGKDGICPGDSDEPFADINGNGTRDSNEPYIDLNKNGTWNGAWKKPDEGEGNRKYDIGESIGTTKIKLGGPDTRINFSGSTGSIIAQAIFSRKMFDIIAENFKGGILDIGAIVGQSNENLRNLACSFGISFPEIRLWEFFVSPTSLRKLLPPWDPVKKDVIIQRDTEPFEDAGLDRMFSWQYENYHPISNSDPDKDDLGPQNNSDDVDTNWNGKCSMEEAYRAWTKKQKGEETNWEIEYIKKRDCVNFIDNGYEDFDLGTEGNLFFDWIDKNGNKVPDLSDITEKWDDNYGILNGRPGSYKDQVAGNNKFDVLDSEHYWPNGEIDPKNTVGPGGLLCPSGPYRGDDREVIDLVYMLLPDPTFSGVIRFYKGTTGVIKNVDGVILTENALFWRNIWRAVYVAQSLGITLIENYPYR